MDDFSSLKVLVTGGAGFIGSHLCEALIARSAIVTALDNFDPFYDRAEKEANLKSCLQHKNFSLVEGDIRDSMMVRAVLGESQPSLIIHLAARAGVRPSIQDPEFYVDVNVRGTSVLLEAARVAGIRNFIFASSSSVYGNQNPSLHRSSFIAHRFLESDSTDFPLSPYGATKKAGELLCHTYHHLYEMPVCCLRFFTVYGPRQRPDLAIRKFTQLALDGSEIPIYGDGNSSRDYTHIRDVLTGVLGAIHWVQKQEPQFGIFNLGSSRPIVLNDLIAMIEELTGHKIKTTHLQAQAGDVEHTFADTTLAESELGFRREVDFREGLREFVEWTRKRIEN
jgi:UDP-glucuronate 4-epimerase